MYIVKKTLQFREKADSPKVVVKASPEPQKLPKAIADEAIKKGFAEKVAAPKKAPAKKEPVEPSSPDDQQGGAANPDDGNGAPPAE